MSYTKKPKMILFDVGGTLFNDGRCDPLAGFQGLISHADNPQVGDAGKMAKYWDELMDDFKSLINHYHHEKLAKNPTLMHKKRKCNFNHMRFKKLFRFLPRFTIPTYEQMVETLNNADSLESTLDSGNCTE